MKIISDFDLTNYNSYRVKSKCKRAIFPESEEELIEYLKSKPNYFLIGSGHNIIFSKDFYEEDFLIFNGNFKNYEINNEKGLIVAESGISMLELSEIALENSLSGLEIFYDIPSSLGGAVVMNAGASGEEIKDVLTKVRYFDLNSFETIEISKTNIDFEYRNSFFQKNTKAIVLKVWMELRPAEYEGIRQKMENIKQARWSKQPKELPNAGSVFKRPKGYYVGAIIDELNLKGFTVGGAQISPKHGGFIVNFNNATGNDILEIIREVKSRVFEKYGLDLEVEQRII